MPLIAVGALFVAPSAAAAAPVSSAVADLAIPAVALSAAVAVSSDPACVSDLGDYLVRVSGDPGDPIENPVLLVHGWLSTAAPAVDGSGTEIPDSPFARDVAWDGEDTVTGTETASLEDRLAALPNTTVFAFDYSQIAAIWVDDTEAVPALAAAIDCLAAASGQSVDIVAHSMGGLALRLALGGDDDGTAANVGQVITVATPTTGSDVAAWVSALGSASQGLFSAAPVLFNVLVPTFVSVCNDELESDARFGCDIPPSIRTLIAVGGNGGSALQAGSSELSSVPDWPASITVHAIAGDYRVVMSAEGLFSSAQGVLGWLGIDVAGASSSGLDLGDGIVGVDSATEGADSTFVASCTLDVDLTADGIARALDEIDSFGGIAPFAGPCAHDSLFQNLDVVDDIVDVIAAPRG